MSIVMQQTLTSMTCYSCGVLFAAPDGWVGDRRNDHADFWCPNGHRQHFIGKSEAEREREKRIRAEARAARMEDKAEVLERRRRAEKAAKTRMLNRVKNGVCPLCNRSFADLKAHMDTKHAEVDVHAHAE